MNLWNKWHKATALFQVRKIKVLSESKPMNFSAAEKVFDSKIEALEHKRGRKSKNTFYEIARIEK